MTTIPDAAIEAAASVLYGQGWDQAGNSSRKYHRDWARDAVAAALPHLTPAAPPLRVDARALRLRDLGRRVRLTKGTLPRWVEGNLVGLEQAEHFVRLDIDGHGWMPVGPAHRIEFVQAGDDAATEPAPVLADANDQPTSSESQTASNLDVRLQARLLSGEHVGREVVLPDGTRGEVTGVEHGVRPRVWLAGTFGNGHGLAPDDVVTLVTETETDHG